MSKEVCRADWEEEEDFDVVKILNRNRKFQELRYIIALQICVGLFQFQMQMIISRLKISQIKPERLLIYVWCIIRYVWKIWYELLNHDIQYYRNFNNLSIHANICNMQHDQNWMHIDTCGKLFTRFENGLGCNAHFCTRL